MELTISFISGAVLCYLILLPQLRQNKRYSSYIMANQDRDSYNVAKMESDPIKREYKTKKERDKAEMDKRIRSEYDKAMEIGVIDEETAKAIGIKGDEIY